MTEAVIVAAKRTPVGKAKRGAFTYTRPEDMSKPVIEALLATTGLSGAEIDDLIVGCAMPEAEQGMNLARMVGLHAGLPESVPGVTVNRFCSSGLETIAQAAARITAGYVDAVIAGGVETMSMIPMGGNKIVGHQGIVEGPHADVYMSMGNTAEVVVDRYAEAFGLTRKDLDTFALESNLRAAKAIESGLFDEEIVPVSYTAWRNGDKITGVLKRDEGPRADTTLEGLGALKAAFKQGGRLTAGNSSQMSDGAAYVLITSLDFAKHHNLRPLGYFRNYQVVGVKPDEMGVGPAYAIPKLLDKTGLTTGDIDTYEINEAFASQALYCVRKLGLDPEKVNPNGGAIALGHPLGCTGAKLTVQILHHLKRTGGRRGIVSMCIGGGMGAAGLIERAVD